MAGSQTADNTNQSLRGRASEAVAQQKDRAGDARDMLATRFEMAKQAGRNERLAAISELEDNDLRRQLRAQELRTGEPVPATDPSDHWAAGAFRKSVKGKEKFKARCNEFEQDHAGQISGGRLFSLVSGAVVLGLTIIVLLLMILISGEFSASIDDSGDFSNASNSTVDNGETAFDIMSVATLVVPVVVVVGLLVGAFMGGGGVNLGR